VGVFNGMFPVLAGKEEDARAFAAEATGARLAGFEAHHARAGTTRETWALQETPMGNFILVWFEAMRATWKRRLPTSRPTTPNS
jgi:hypothetical protein